MKSKILILTIIAIIIATIVTLLTKTTASISKIKSFHFSYTTSTAMNAYVIYEINCEENVNKAKIKPSGVDDKGTLEIPINKKTIAKLEKILQEYEIEKWNGFDKNDKYVLDGNSFNLSIRTEDNNSISASGYMKWPQNYNNVKKELDTLFGELYKKNK